MPRAKEICPLVILGTRAIGSAALAWSMRLEFKVRRDERIYV